MTQAVSPEDALKALVEAIWAVRQPPPNDAYMLKMVMSHDTAVAIAKAVLNTRTVPPKTVLDDDVVALMDDLRQFQDADDHILEKHARRILTRLKDRS